MFLFFIFPHTSFAESEMNSFFLSFRSMIYSNFHPLVLAILFFFVAAVIIFFDKLLNMICMQLIDCMIVSVTLLM